MIKTALQIKTIGSILKEKRKDLKLELTDVSNEIKISVIYLQALEEGSFSKFPSEVYLKGFLKNYAKFLGISTEKALALYRRENERKQNESSINAVINSKPKTKAFTFTPNKIIAGIAILAIVMILIYLSTYVGRVIKVPKLELNSPITMTTDTEGLYKTDANFITISGIADIGSTLTINEQELKLNSFEKFSEEFNLIEGTNDFIIKAESQFGRSKTIKLQITKEAGNPLPTVTATVAPLEILLDIEIVKADAQIAISVDGVSRTDRVYKPGSTIEFNAKEKIELTTNKPSSLQVLINGKAVVIDSNLTSWEIVDGEIVSK